MLELHKLKLIPNYEKLEKNLVDLNIEFEDFGEGMTNKEREDYLLTIFSSSKEKNPNKIGKYGIGFLTPFMLKPDDFIIESTGISPFTKNPESWGLHMMDLNKKPKYKLYDIDQRKGTRVILRKRMGKKVAEQLKHQLYEKINYFCNRSRIPIYIDGKFINKDFRLDTPLQIHRTSPGLEYVVGVEEYPIYEFHNHRLKLEQGYVLYDNWPNLSFLVSSIRFHHTFSRDMVLRDKNFELVSKELKNSIKHLFLYALERVEHYTENPIDDFNNEPPGVHLECSNGSRYVSSLWLCDDFLTRLDHYHSTGFLQENINKASQKLVKLREDLLQHEIEMEKIKKKTEESRNELKFAWEFVDKFVIDKKFRIEKEELKKSRDRIYPKLKKALPRGYESYKIFQLIDGEHVGLDTVLDILNRDNKLYFIYNRDKELESVLERHGITVFSEQTDFLRKLGSMRYANREFYTSCEIKDKSSVSVRESGFLEGNRSYLSKKYRTRIRSVYFTSNNELADNDKNEPLLLISTLGKKNIGEKISLWNRFKDSMYFGFSSHDIAINLDNHTIQQLITIYNQVEDKKQAYSMFSGILKTKNRWLF